MAGLKLFTYNQVIVRTATFSSLKMTANITQILNFKHNFHKEFELFKKNLSVLTMVIWTLSDCQHTQII